MDTNKIFKEMAQYKLMIKEAEKELKAREAQVKALMEEQGIDELIGDEHKATWKEVTSNTFDSKAFKADHADVYELYKKPSSTMRFTFA